MAPPKPRGRPRPGRLILGAALSLAAVLVLFAVSLDAYIADARWVDHALDLRKEAYEWVLALVDAETGARGYLATDRPIFLEPYEAAQLRERATAARVRALGADSATQIQNVEAADYDALVMMDDLRSRVALARAGHRDEALAGLGDSKARMDRFREAADTVLSEGKRLLDARRGRARSGGLAALLTATGLALASCFLLALAWQREGVHERLVAALASDRWLTTTLRSIGDAVIATDAEGRVAFLNPVAEALTGWTGADAQGRALDEVFCIFSEQTRLAVESPVTKVLREGTIVGLANHTVLRSKRALEVPIDDSGAPIRNEAGEILGVVLVFRDVTQEKRNRVRSDFLAKAGEVLVSSIDLDSTLATVARLAVPTLADWCAVDLIDPQAQADTRPRQVAVAHVDETKVRLARELNERYPPDPAAPTGVHQVIRSGKSELYVEIPQALLESGARDAEHLRIIRELRLESAMVVPLRARGRSFGAVTFVYADSGRRYNEDDLVFAEDFARRAAMAIDNALILKETAAARVQERHLRSEAEMASRAKDEFLATVSHELRTPLNAILGWTVTLRRRKVPEDVDRALAIVERNARLQTKLIEDVLDISRIISGKLALNLGPTNVVEAVSAAVETVTPAAEAKDITATVEVPDPSLIITADADRLQQIVWNLLANAVKFTPKHGRVAVRAFRDGSDVCISITDTGEGIRRDVLPLVFEAFQQADASTTRRHGGLGLGLAIVKRLVSAHGGTVLAESEGEGKGATFTVRLPARVPAISRAARSNPGLDGFRDGLREAPRLDGLKLLVVDDEEDALTLVREALSEQGAEVHVAASAHEALEKFTRLRPDVVVSDIGMPEADGFFLIRKIRALPVDQGGRTPAVALTAYARADDANRAFAAGYQMHVAKPVEPTQLATVVANLGGRSS